MTRTQKVTEDLLHFMKLQERATMTSANSSSKMLRTKIQTLASGGLHFMQPQKQATLIFVD